MNDIEIIRDCALAEFNAAKHFFLTLQAELSDEQKVLYKLETNIEYIDAQIALIKDVPTTNPDQHNSEVDFQRSVIRPISEARKYLQEMVLSVKNHLLGHVKEELARATGTTDFSKNQIQLVTNFMCIKLDLEQMIKEVETQNIELRSNEINLLFKQAIRDARLLMPKVLIEDNYLQFMNSIQNLIRHEQASDSPDISGVISKYADNLLLELNRSLALIRLTNKYHVTKMRACYEAVFPCATEAFVSSEATTLRRLTDKMSGERAAELAASEGVNILELPPRTQDTYVERVDPGAIRKSLAGKSLFTLFQLHQGDSKTSNSVYKHFQPVDTIMGALPEKDARRIKSLNGLFIDITALNGQIKFVGKMKAQLIESDGNITEILAHTEKLIGCHNRIDALDQEAAVILSKVKTPITQNTFSLLIGEDTTSLTGFQILIAKNAEFRAVRDKLPTREVADASAAAAVVPG